MDSHSDDKCPRCQAQLGEGEPYVLLPAADVPAAGSRTEVLVTPGRCLRVRVRACERGHLTFERLRAGT